MNSRHFLLTIQAKPTMTLIFIFVFNRISGSERKYQAELRKIDLPIIDRESCQTRLRSTKLGQYFQLHGSFICAGGETDRDMCRGDGGGPLVCQTSTGQFYQVHFVTMKGTFL